MTSSPVKAYLDRSVAMLRRNAVKVLQMDMSPNPPPLPIFSFSSASSSTSLTPVSSFALGSDIDIGGLSTAFLTPVTAPSLSSSSASIATGFSHDEHHAIGKTQSQSHVAFHGNMSLVVPQAYQGRIRTGYAAFRNKTRPSLFGEETWDLSMYTHLRLVVGYRGWEGWRSRWVVNIQTDGPIRSDLFQHRLRLPPTPTPASIPSDPLAPPPPIFTTLHLPLAEFVLTNSGQTSATQIPMLRERVRTIGFGLLGGDRGGVAPPPPPPAAVAEKLKRLGAGGWGDGPVEMDSELEELISADTTTPSSMLSQHGNGGGYHRATSPFNEKSEMDEMVTSESEGYFELCVRSVDAIKYDPEEE
ncbi:hypothetical protein TREMEDRAFT_61736 [Tremella mesenterica DSM 1558]|uniref:uncharacterized protein n=1 Tax=Tremella mesenterica (strain ATCC 24925 / CBS 8224 / DSM 1558 / NBRC 9311 / NRRL Y-6157 / RJB 2259-6 / UBC 559-6) TaxID=578456 RepID=UPI0003F49E5E|nr:uncharacterized protein TREMEDRAFT_61736 [Tremella mesenterica DSM 1558]EIW69969.1 hypothetical protein TREMEDRAFT_61736 [Tremella mesenterica DSM 1558]